MSHLTETVRRHRGRALAAIVVLLTAAVTSVFAPQLASARPAPAPAAQINVTGAFSATFTSTFPAGLDTPGVGTSYVLNSEPFVVSFTTSAPLSTVKSTPLLLTVTTGPDAGTLSVPFELPANATSGNISGAVLPHAANGVTLKVAVDAKKTDVLPGTLGIDVFESAAPTTKGTALTGFGGGGGEGVPCVPTAAEPQCFDLLLPETAGMLTNGLLSKASCVGVCGHQGTFNAQVLVGVDPAVYGVNNPIEVVVKCDRSLCPGKGISTYKAYVELAAGTGVTLSPACAAKGVITPEVDGAFCTDYVQSKRDGAGDLHLYIELPYDAKIIW